MRGAQSRSEFADVIRTHAYGAFVVGMDTHAYRETMKGLRAVSPEVFCFERLVGRLHHRMREWRVDSDFVEVTLDAGDSSSTKFLSSWMRMKSRQRENSHLLTAIAFADDQHILPVQAADFLANGVKRGLHDPQHTWEIDDSPWRRIFQGEDSALYGLFFEQENWNSEAFAARAEEIRRVAQMRPTRRQPSPSDGPHD